MTEPPDRPRIRTSRDRRPGTPSSRRASPGPTSSSRRGPTSRRSTAGRRTGSSPTPGPTAASAPRSSSVGRARCRGPSRTRRAVRSPRPGPRTPSRRSPSACGPTSGPLAGASATCGSTPRSRRTGRSTRAAPCGRRCGPPTGDRRRRSSRRRRGSSTCGPTRRPCGATCARSGASTSTRPGPAASSVVDADGDRLGDFYRIYRETAARAGFLIRTEAAYRDVWEAYRPAGRARLLFAETADGEPVATLFLVRSGPRVVEPYGGMTARRRGLAGELPPQVGGDPHLARAGRDELRPVGPRDRRDRPLQDRLRRPRGAVHRGLGPRARSARAAGLRGGGQGPRPLGAVASRASRARPAAAGFGGDE